MFQERRRDILTSTIVVGAGTSTLEPAAATAPKKGGRKKAAGGEASTAKGENKKAGAEDTLLSGLLAKQEKKTGEARTTLVKAAPGRVTPASVAQMSAKMLMKLHILFTASESCCIAVFIPSLVNRTSKSRRRIPSRPPCQQSWRPLLYLYGVGVDSKLAFPAATWTTPQAREEAQDSDMSRCGEAKRGRVKTRTPHAL